ncbi:hypothetical protein ABK040_002617 [Willaertia magna]
MSGLTKLRLLGGRCTAPSLNLFKTVIGTKINNNTIHINTIIKCYHSSLFSSNNNKTPEQLTQEQQDKEVLEKIPKIRPAPFEKVYTETKLRLFPNIKENEPLNKEQEEHLLEMLKRKVLMHCRNRGRVETELFLGGFARDHLHNMNLEKIEQFYEILCEHDSDLYIWLVGQEELPDDLKSSEMMKEIMDYVNSKKVIKYYETDAQLHKKNSKDKKGTFNEEYDNTDTSDKMYKL